MLYFLLLTFALSEETANTNENSDDSDCICDITRNSCDVYCCCDSDCAKSLIKEWDLDDPEDNICLNEKYSTYGEILCKQEEVFYIENARQGMRTANDIIRGGLCVLVDNSDPSIKYHDYVDSPDSAVIDTRIEDNVEYSDLLIVQPNENDRDYYQTSEPVAALLNSQVRFKYTWPLPGPDNYGFCNNMHSVRWLISEAPRLCTRRLEQAECTTELKLSQYISSVQISTSPVFGTGTLLQITDVQYYQRFTDTNTDTQLDAAPTTALQGCSCNNAVVQVDYIVSTDETQTKPATVTAKVVFSNVDVCGLEVNQQFSVKFYTGTDWFERSGNPGYQEGKPVFLGSRSNDIMTVYQQFPLLGVSETGACITTNQLTANSDIIRFRQDTVLNCYLEFTFDELLNYCTSTSANNEELLIFNSHRAVTHVGKFGDIEFDNPDDWVEIQATWEPSKDWNEAGRCTISNMLVFDIVSAEIGDVANPQPKIIYAQRRFASSNPWVYNYPDRTKKQKFFNTVVVNFIRYEEDVSFFTPPAPNPIPVMPDDILYPFRVSSSIMMKISWLLLCIILIQ